MEQQTTKWIKLWTVTRANEDMKGWSWKEINWVRYYTFNQAIETAKQQWLTLPTKQDFIDSWFTTERSKENKELADKLWFTLDGYCYSDGELNTKGRYGYRWSASPKDNNDARHLEFVKNGGKLTRDSSCYALPVRPVLKNSTSDISSIWKFKPWQEIRDISWFYIHWRIVAIDIHDRIICEFDGIEDEVFVMKPEDLSLEKTKEIPDEIEVDWIKYKRM